MRSYLLVRENEWCYSALLAEFSIHHFMNGKIDSCERLPYFDLSKRGACHRIQCFLIDKACMYNRSNSRAERASLLIFHVWTVLEERLSV